MTTIFEVYVTPTVSVRVEADQVTVSANGLVFSMNTPGPLSDALGTVATFSTYLYWKVVAQ